MMIDSAQQRYGALFCLLAAVALLFAWPMSGHAGERVDLSQREGLQEMIVSVKSLDRTIALYQEVAEWELAYRGSVPRELLAHWGLAQEATAEQAVLRVPGAEKGYLRLVRFEGVPQVRIRSSARPFDTGGIFNFNTLVRDMTGVFEHLREHGFDGFADPTYYVIFGARYGGAMLRGHDGVVINLLERVGDPLEDIPPFTRMSHIFNATQMVSDYNGSFEFFTEKLGWYAAWEASPSWPEDGSNNLGIPHNLIVDGTARQRAAGFKFSPQADGGGVEIFEYQGITGRDFSDRAHPPNLGVLAYRIHVADVRAYAKVIIARGVEIHRPLRTFELAPYGLVAAFVVQAPSGAWLEFFSQE